MTEDVEILSITPVEGRGSLRAFVNLRIGDLIINDCRIIQEIGKGPWFSMPVLSYRDEHGTNRYRTIVQVINENLKNKISQAVLDAWRNNNRRNNGNQHK